MDDEHDPSRLRLKLRQTEEERTRHLERLLSERGPLIRGSYVAQPGRCGNPSCKCARGEFHSAAALYTRVEGRATCIYVPVGDRPRVEALNMRDREFRKARSALAKLGRKTVQLANQLQETLTESYPTSKPAKPSGSGRRRKEPSS
jgi:hypothetical protein